MIDREAIRRLEEISPAGEDLVGDLIRIFSEETPRVIASMKENLDLFDYASLKKSAHHLKSSCANLGALSMRELAEKIEKQSTEGDRAFLQNLVEILERDFLSSLRELDGHRRTV